MTKFLRTVFQSKTETMYDINNFHKTKSWMKYKIQDKEKENLFNFYCCYINLWKIV